MKKWIEMMKSYLPLDSIKNHPLVLKLIDFYEALPPERKKAALIGGTGGILLTCFLIFNASFSYLHSVEEETKVKRDKILNIALEYDDLLTKNKSQLDTLEKKLETSKQIVPAQALKEILLKKGLMAEDAIKTLEDTPKKMIGEIQEVSSQVELARISLKQLVDILTALDSPMETWSIQSLNIQPMADNPDFLNTSLNIYSFRKRQ